MHAGAEYMICNDNFILRKYDYFSFSPSNMYNNQDQKVNVKITETERKEALKLGLEPSLIFFQPKFYQGVNVQKYPELIQDYVDWQFADEYFEKQQKKIETIKDLVLPGLSSVVTPYTYKGS